MADGWVCPGCRLWQENEDDVCSCGHVVDPAMANEMEAPGIRDDSPAPRLWKGKGVVTFLLASVLVSVVLSLFKAGEGAVYKRFVGIILIFGPVVPHLHWKRLFHSTLIGGFTTAGIVMLMTLFHDGPLAMLEPGRSYARSLPDGTLYVVDGFSMNMVKDSLSLTAHMLPILAIACLTWALVSGLPFHFYRKRSAGELAGQAARKSPTGNSFPAP